MNKLNRDIVKSIKKLNAETTASYKLFFAELKQKGIVAIADLNWNKPFDRDFKIFGADAKRYVQSLRNDVFVKFIGSFEIKELLEYPDNYVFVSVEELKKFETVTYPKLYAEWKAEQKQKRTDTANDANKIRAKIAKLQKQLNKLEN